MLFMIHSFVGGLSSLKVDDNWRHPLAWT